MIKRGHDVHVLTNYPVWAARRFGLPPECVHSFWPHGVLCRLVDRLGLSDPADAFVHKTFGRWAAEEMRRHRWDVIHAFSGVAEEALRIKNTGLHLLVRGSAHIRMQDEILEEESARVGVKLERPTRWKIAREEREYELCDRILVLSRFAYASFINKGVPPEKLAFFPLGADTHAFRPTEETLERRCHRILSNLPLTVLFVGNLSFQKGLHDFARITRALNDGRFRFRVIGTITKEAKQFAARYLTSVEFIRRQPESQLPSSYAEGDLFLFPTLQDGYAVVLAQAQASSLPLLTSPNCAGPELVSEGETGWVRPIRNADAFIERLVWCDRNRDELATMVRRIHTKFQFRDWDDVAATFDNICTESGIGAN
jgi:glycosyltransferase involved in cell wall biosynthesis